MRSINTFSLHFNIIHVLLADPTAASVEVTPFLNKKKGESVSLCRRIITGAKFTVTVISDQLL